MKKTCFIFLLFILFSFNLKAEEATWDGASNTGLFIIPKELANFCALTEESAKTKAEVVSCINKILRLKEDEDAQVSEDAEKLTQIALLERSEADFAKGVASKVFASQYPTSVLDLMSQSHEAGDNNNKDKLNAIWELEKESSTLQNTLLIIKSVELALNTLIEINNYKGQYDD